MQEFFVKNFSEHPRIQLLKMTHVFNNYVPRGEVDFGGMAKTVDDLKSELEKLQTKVGNLGKAGPKKRE
jgi:archaellum component FlaC